MSKTGSRRGTPRLGEKAGVGRPRRISYSLKPFISPLIVARATENKFWSPELEEKWRKDFFAKARYVDVGGTMSYFQREDFAIAYNASVIASKAFGSLKNKNRILDVVEPDFVREFDREYRRLTKRLREGAAKKLPKRALTNP